MCSKVADKTPLQGITAGSPDRGRERYRRWERKGGKGQPRKNLTTLRISLQQKQHKEAGATKKGTETGVKGTERGKHRPSCPASQHFIQCRSAVQSHLDANSISIFVQGHWGLRD